MVMLATRFLTTMAMTRSETMIQEQTAERQRSSHRALARRIGFHSAVRGDNRARAGR
jgi:hypothetical protein